MITVEDVVWPGNWEDANWELLRKPNAAPGRDGVGVREYLHSLVVGRRSQALRDAICSGQYTWDPILKRSMTDWYTGKRRTICLLTGSDRLVLKAVSILLSRKLNDTFSIGSFAYRSELGPGDAVHAARQHLADGYHFVVAADIRKFFDRVPQKLVLRLLCPHVCSAVYQLVRKSLQRHAPGGIGIVQGSPLAPVLSNLVLNVLDRELERRGHRFIRYADDIFIFCTSLRGGRLKRHNLSQFLESHLSLSLSEKLGTGVKHFSETSILGFVFNHNLETVPSPESLKKAEAKILRLIAQGDQEKLQTFRRSWEKYFGPMMICMAKSLAQIS